MAYQMSIEHVGHLGLLNLRASAEALAPIARALEFELPRRALETTSAPGCVALWLGPNEWLLRVSGKEETRWQAVLQQAFGSRHAALTVVSDAYAVLELCGAQVRDVLVQGTEFDLHPLAFRPAQCAALRFAKTQIILHHIDAAPIYHVFVWRSYERYLVNWLQRARGD